MHFYWITVIIQPGIIQNVWNVVYNIQILEILISDLKREYITSKTWPLSNMYDFDLHWA